MPTTPKAPQKLEDLDDATRAALMAELKAQQTADAAATVTDADRIAQARLKLFAARMDARDHLRNCPAVDKDGAPRDGMTPRFEAYGATKPAQPDKAIAARPVTVVRCIECGGTTLVDEPYDGLFARLTAAATDNTDE